MLLEVGLHGIWGTFNQEPRTFPFLISTKTNLPHHPSTMLRLIGGGQRLPNQIHMFSHLERQQYLIPSFVYILKDFDARLNILMINIGNRCKTHLKPHEEGQVFDTCRISARRQRGLERKCCFREVFQHPVSGSNLRICHFFRSYF